MANLLTLKATLLYPKPAVWRRLVLPDTLSFWELHFALQLAFGWENAHLFEFSTGRGSPNDFLTGTPPGQPGDEDYLPEWWRDPRQVALTEILRAPKDKVSYVYDMGDHWEHQLVVEQTIPLASGAPLPPVRCLAGRRASPPEDIGGIPGYELLLEALAEKAAGTRKRMPSQFSGLGKYDPDDAGLDSANDFLTQLPAIVAEQDALLAAHQAMATTLPRPPRSTGADILHHPQAQGQPPAPPEA